MREYVKQICTYLDFPAEATEEFCAAWDKLAAEPQALGVWKCWIGAYEQDIFMDYGAALEETGKASETVGVHKYTSDLLLFLCLTRRLRQLYEKRGIGERIYRDSCMDLHWKLFECRKIYGVWGSFVAWWFQGFFNLTRFALGRLQFELVDFPAGYEEAGRKKPEPLAKAINMHIPSCGKLTAEACEDSFHQAEAFFADAFTGDEVAFCCESWLLYPGHRTMLPADSGMVRFMDWFDIYRTGDTDGDLWRIYDRMDTSDLAALPERTALQRGYKQLLLRGEHPGYGEGVFYYNRKTGQFHR